MYCIWLGRDHDHSTESSRSLNSSRQPPQQHSIIEVSYKACTVCGWAVIMITAPKLLILSNNSSRQPPQQHSIIEVSYKVCTVCIWAEIMITAPKLLVLSNNSTVNHHSNTVL